MLEEELAKSLPDKVSGHTSQDNSVGRGAAEEEDAEEEDALPALATKVSRFLCIKPLQCLL